MEKYFLLYKDGYMVIQESEYQEDGWIISIIDGIIILREIPLFGGVPIEIGKFNSIPEAIEHAKTLT